MPDMFCHTHPILVRSANHFFPQKRLEPKGLAIKIFIGFLVRLEVEKKVR